MFGRQFRQAGHRQHMPNPNSPGYTFERIGSTREALGSRKQASSLTWGHETAEQSILGEDVWFAYSGDGFNASVSEESPGSGRFTADLYTDSDLYKHLSTTEYGFESVDEAKSFVEGVFGYSRVGSRTASRTAQTFTEWMATTYPGKELLDLPRAERSRVLNEYQNEVGEGNEVWASRRTAFLDTVHLAEPRHRVAGWSWDDHLNGFIAAEAAREFTCACGDNVPAPGYTDCRCGKRWNTYSISANGSKKMIAREVPVRENVVMARRTAFRKQASGLWQEDGDTSFFLYDSHAGDFYSEVYPASGSYT